MPILPHLKLTFHAILKGPLCLNVTDLTVVLKIAP